MAEATNIFSAGMSTHCAFELTAHREWLRHLEEEGFVVIKGVASSGEVEKAKCCLWKDMHAHFGVEKADISTWSKIPNGAAGLVSRCLPQSEGAWNIRALDTIKEAFSKIWKTDQLLVSMDSVLLWLPWWKNEAWKPTTEGLHIDQNPFFKPELCCVQGMVPLIDVNDESGGLEVVPRSHLPKFQESFKSRHRKYQTRKSDWCPLNEGDPLAENRQLIKASAGDLILWDSRLLHGGKVGRGEQTKRMQGTGMQDTKTDVASCSVSKPELARLSITVCMTPRQLASEDVLKRRKRGFEKGHTFTHWPHEAHITGISPRTPFDLTPRQMLLL